MSPDQCPQCSANLTYKSTERMAPGRVVELAYCPGHDCPVTIVTILTEA